MFAKQKALPLKQLTCFKKGLISLQTIKEVFSIISMMLQLLKVKIQELIVKESNMEYPGSISLPDELFEASGIKQFELVHVNNKTNGNRIITYAVKNKQPGFVSINGAASKLFKQGDMIHVLAFVYLNETEADTFQPKLVLTDKENKVIASKPYMVG